MGDSSDFRFRRVSDLRSGDVVERVAALTKRSPSELLYLLAEPAHPHSRVFCIEDSAGLIVGFQAFVHKLLRRGNDDVNGFRSEFTIALPRLRGTGIFTKFYTWTLDQLRDEWGTEATYVFGETAHKAWLNYGFRIITKYSFHQLIGPPGQAGGRFATTINSRSYRVVARGLRSLTFLLRARGSGSDDVEVATSLSLDKYLEALAAARPRRWRILYDQQTLQNRYVDNPFYNYEFWSTPGCLLVVKQTREGCEISDVLADGWRSYQDVLGALTRRYRQIELRGNILSEARAPYFWINMAFGGLPLVGGGSYVENNETAKQVTLRDVPLYEAYSFGTPGL